MTDETKRAEGWNTLQARIEHLAQTLFNVRDAGALQAAVHGGPDITDAPAGVRAALEDLHHEITMWQGKLAGTPVPEPDLREHTSQLHPRLASAGKSHPDKTQAQMAHAHAQDHDEHGSPSHHHGADAGPHGRPAGLRDGSGVVRIDLAASKQARPAGKDH